MMGTSSVLTLTADSRTHASRRHQYRGESLSNVHEMYQRSTAVSLVVVWCYSFAKCYHRANLGTMYITSVCVTSYNNADESTIISITTAIKNKGGKKVNKNFF